MENNFITANCVNMTEADVRTIVHNLGKAMSVLLSNIEANLYKARAFADVMDYSFTHGLTELAQSSSSSDTKSNAARRTWLLL